MNGAIHIYVYLIMLKLLYSNSLISIGGAAILNRIQSSVTKMIS